VTSYGNVADVPMSPRKYFFEKVALLGSPETDCLELLVEFFRLKDHELIHLGV
jgi:hypothetical protein